MQRYMRIATAGVAITMIGVLAGCTTNSETTPLANTTAATPTTNNTVSNSAVSNNTVTSANSTTNALVANTTGANTTNTTGTPPVTNTTTSSTSTAPVILENIQYVNDALLLLMTHGTMQTTYADPHFSTTGATQQFIVTLRNTAPGKYSLNKVQPLNTNWAKSLTITKSGNDLILTFDLKQAFHSFQVGIGGGFEISFNFK